MASLPQAKAFGSVGSILFVLSIIPYAGPLLGIIGLILVLIAIKYIAEVVDDQSIFNNMLVAVVIAVVGIVVALLVGIASFIGVGTVPSMPAWMSRSLSGALLTIALTLALVWASMVLSALFLRRSYNAIAARLDVGMFSTVALLYLIGALLTAILIGFLIILIANILQAVAFLSIPEQLPRKEGGYSL